MNELHEPEAGATWEAIAPHLDEALGQLSGDERDAVLLRYFERRSAREMAQILNTSEQAAQKRVSRAVARLRDLFDKRGITVGTSGLVVVISANAVQIAPAGLAVTISTTAALAGTTLAATATATTAKAIAMTAIQKTLITATILAFLAQQCTKAAVHQVREPTFKPSRKNKPRSPSTSGNSKPTTKPFLIVSFRPTTRLP